MIFAQCPTQKGNVFGVVERINIIQGGNRNWLWGLSCPYESMAALERNWEFDKSYINGYRIK